ncbi:uncharacterized protein RB166_014357 [Leptodactylus fuscus]
METFQLTVLERMASHCHICPYVLGTAVTTVLSVFVLMVWMCWKGNPFTIKQAPAPRHTTISGQLHSSISLETLFDKRTLKDVTWSHENPLNKLTIAKIFNGQVTDLLNDRYKPSEKGEVLVIEHLTEKDNGDYTAVSTLPNDTLVKETFHLTVLDGQNDVSETENSQPPFQNMEIQESTSIETPHTTIRSVFGRRTRQK